MSVSLARIPLGALLLVAAALPASAGTIARARVALAPDPVDAVAFSPDGKTLATSGSRGPVRLWDPETWELRATLPQVGDVSRMAFSPDGRHLYVGGEVVVRYDLETGREDRRYRDHARGVSDLLLSPDGRTLLSASYAEGRRIVRDTETGKLLRDTVGAAWSLRRGPGGVGALFKTGPKRWVHEGFRDEIARPFAPPETTMSMAVSRDGLRVACANGHWDFTVSEQPGRLALYRLGAAGYRRVREIEVEDRHEFGRLELSPDGRLLATAGRYARLRFRSVPDLVERGRVREPYAGAFPVRDLAFSPDGRLVAAAIGKPSPVLVRTEGLERIAPWPGHGRSILEFAFTADGKRIVTIGRDNLVGVWDAATLERMARHRVPDGFEPVAVRAPAAGLLLCHRDAHVIESWPGGRPVILFDPVAGKTVLEDVIPARSRAEAAFFREDGGGVLLRVKGPFRTLGALDEPIPFGAVPRAARDDSVIVDGRIQLRPERPGKRPAEAAVVRRDLDLGKEEVRRPPPGEEGSGWSVGLAPGGRFFVAAPDVRVYDLETCRLVGLVRAPKVERGTVTFSHDGRCVAFVTTGPEAEVRIHEVASGDLVGAFPAAAGKTRARLSPSGDRVAALGDDGRLEVRELR